MFQVGGDVFAGDIAPARDGGAGMQWGVRSGVLSEQGGDAVDGRENRTQGRAA